MAGVIESSGAANIAAVERASIASLVTEQVIGGSFQEL
jgi:hypothetical protein